MKMDQDKIEVGRWWVWVTVLIAFSVIVFGILNFAGVIGERFIFENSFQYQESRNTAITTYESQLAELEGDLRKPNLTPAEIAGIESQIKAITIRLNAEKRKVSP